MIVVGQRPFHWFELIRFVLRNNVVLSEEETRRIDASLDPHEAVVGYQLALIAKERAVGRRNAGPLPFFRDMGFEVPMAAGEPPIARVSWKPDLWRWSLVVDPARMRAGCVQGVGERSPLKAIRVMEAVVEEAV